MSQIWIYSLASVLIVSCISFIGILTIVFRREYLKGFLLFMVSFAAGALLGDVFIHLLPELIAENGFSLSTSLYILGGIFFFFVLEKIMHWRHCHMAASGTDEHVHPLAAMNLVGGAFHNFIDGALIAGSYLLSIPVGIATTVAVILHEIPQELGDFGVLLHSGMKVKKALLLNFCIELISILGVVLVLGLGFDDAASANFIIPVTIGGFLYIANADLIPELHKDVKPRNSIFQLISFLAGVGVMALLLLLPGHTHQDEEHGHGHEAQESHEFEDANHEEEHE